MKVSLLQKRSKGIAGTYQNAEHHARELLPLLKQIQMFLEDADNGLPSDVEWIQGHNVHLLRQGGRTFVLRPFRAGPPDNRPYVGINLALRVSRTLEVSLGSILHDEPFTLRMDFIKVLDFVLASYRGDSKPENSGDLKQE